MFVDSNCNIVNDTSKAEWYYYNLYYHGNTVGGFKSDFLDPENLDDVKFLNRPKNDTSEIEPIDGKFKVMLKNKYRTTYIFIIERGFIKELHLINDSDGTNWEIYNYQKKYNNNPFSFFYRAIHPISNDKIRETYYYYENGKFKKDKSSKKVNSTKYFDNMTFEK